MSSPKFSHPIPDSLAQLPVDPRGYPIPDGVWKNPETEEWDFRVIDQRKRMRALKKYLCAVSGLPMEKGQYWFIGGLSSVEQRLFMDGPMRHEVAEFSLMTCPHLLLPNAQYRRVGAEDRYHPQLSSDEKSKECMLGMAGSFKLQTYDDFPYVRAGPWRALSFWRNGKTISKEEARALLAAKGIKI